MTEKDEKFSLDNSAAELYKQLAGIDDSDRAHADISHSALMRLLNQQEKLLDYYRLLLSESTCLFAGILENCHFPALAEENNQKIKVLLATLKKIADFPDFDGKVHGLLRGQQCPTNKTGSEAYDYELSFGGFLVDYQVALTVGEREKSHGEAIFAKLMEAFQALSAMNMFNFSIDIGNGEDEDFRKIETTLRYLMKYYTTKDTNGGFIVFDEYDQPSINLTLLAATNNVKPASLQSLVNKVKPMILGPEPDKGLDAFTTVYDAIFAIIDKRQKLKKMPIEVNNAQWLTANLHTSPERTAEVVQISRLVLSKYGNNPRMASEVLSSINSEGYQDIRPEVMGKRLTRATDFMNLTEEDDHTVKLQSEALRNIEEGLDHLPDEMYDQIEIAGEEISTVNDEGQKTSWSLHTKILEIVNFFKRRSSIKKKVQDIANKNVQFDDDDYAVIAKNFKITTEEAANLIQLLRDCFDDKGNFRRNFFEKNIPQFLVHGSKVFEFLWHYLKELTERKDRVSFLNALQPLAAQLKQPDDALNILLADLFPRKTVVKYSDRNALILSNVLLRFSEWTERSEIELTPEEVLSLPREKLNREMISVTHQFFEKNHEFLIQKFRIITEMLLKSSAQTNHEEGEMLPRFLLYQIRELVIFLALVGGQSAQSIIYGVVEEFGDPRSSYYKEMKNKENLRHSLQLLQVAARGLKRFGDLEANAILGEIAIKESDFINLYDEPDPLNHVQRVMENIRKTD